MSSFKDFSKGRRSLNNAKGRVVEGIVQKYLENKNWLVIPIQEKVKEDNSYYSKINSEILEEIDYKFDLFIRSDLYSAEDNAKNKGKKVALPDFVCLKLTKEKIKVKFVEAKSSKLKIYNVKQRWILEELYKLGYEVEVILVPVKLYKNKRGKLETDNLLGLKPDTILKFDGKEWKEK